MRNSLTAASDNILSCLLYLCDVVSVHDGLSATALPLLLTYTTATAFHLRHERVPFVAYIVFCGKANGRAVKGSIPRGRILCVWCGTRFIHTHFNYNCALCSSKGSLWMRAHVPSIALNGERDWWFGHSS